jgi:hypothetical protein
VKIFYKEIEMIFLIIAGLLLILTSILVFLRYGGEKEITVVLGALLGIACIIIGLFAGIKWNISKDTYTGYIYSYKTTFGFVNVSIRYSLNAGQDNQPSFWVREEDIDLIEKYCGTDTKIKAEVPAGFKFVNNPYEPASYATITVMEAEE